MKKGYFLITLLAVLLITFWIPPGYAQYATDNYREIGGARWVIGGSLDVSSGGELDIESGGSLKRGGTEIIGSTGYNLDDDITLENDEKIINSTDAILEFIFNDTALELGDVKYSSSVTTNTTDAAYVRHSWEAANASAADTEWAQMDMVLDDVTSGTEDSSFVWRTITAGSLGSTELKFDGAAVYPTTDAAINLGSASKAFGHVYTDNINGDDHVRVMTYHFYDVDVAASQSAAEWGTDPASDVGGANFKRLPVPAAGSLVSISVYANAACTSGTLTADATIDGTATGLQAVLNSTTATTSAATMQAVDADAMTAGQTAGVKVTTSGTWAPTTADVVVVLGFEY